MGWAENDNLFVVSRSACTHSVSHNFVVILFSDSTLVRQQLVLPQPPRPPPWTSCLLVISIHPTTTSNTTGHTIPICWLIGSTTQRTSSRSSRSSCLEDVHGVAMVLTHQNNNNNSAEPFKSLDEIPLQNVQLSAAILLQ